MNPEWTLKHIIVSIIIMATSAFVVFNIFNAISWINGFLKSDLSSVICMAVGMIYLWRKYPGRDRVQTNIEIRKVLFWGVSSGLLLTFLNAVKVYTTGGVDASYCDEMVGLVSGKILWSYLSISVLIIPIIEEIIFRFYYYRVIRNRYNSVMISGAITCGLFSLAHFSVSSFVYAVVFTCVYEKTNSVIASICSHVLVNSGWYCIVYFGCLPN
jgi:membrane protease YdiL (CAAX protease family)